MTEQTLPKPRFLTSTERCPELGLERLDAFHLQEQFAGPIPVRAERPAAEVLAERLAEPNSAGTTPVFIP
jgi:hypothetical protein